MPKQPAKPTKVKNSKSKDPTKAPFSNTKEKVTLESVFSRWRQYHMVRYAKHYSQDDEKAFFGKLEEEWKEKIEEKLKENLGKKSKAKLKEEYKEERKKYTRHINDLVKLGGLAYRYETTKDHTILPDILTLAHRLKVYPPLGVLGHVAKGFQEFSESKGKKSLDGCLGIRGEPGSRSLLTQQEEKTRDQYYVRTIRAWTMMNGLCVEDACRIAADQYKGPHKLSLETIKQGWRRNKEWKAYRSTLNENDPSDIKKRHPSSKGKRLTPARLLMPIALCLIATERFPKRKRKEDSERKHKKDLKRRCMEDIERNMKVAHLVPETSDYLPRIQKFLSDNTRYPSTSTRLDAIKTLMREALEDSNNPFEFPKNASSEKSFLLKHLSP